MNSLSQRKTVLKMQNQPQTSKRKQINLTRMRDHVIPVETSLLIAITRKYENWSKERFDSGNCTTKGILFVKWCILLLFAFSHFHLLAFFACLRPFFVTKLVIFQASLTFFLLFLFFFLLLSILSFSPRSFWNNLVLYCLPSLPFLLLSLLLLSCFSSFSVRWLSLSFLVSEFVSAALQVLFSQFLLKWEEKHNEGRERKRHNNTTFLINHTVRKAKQRGKTPSGERKRGAQRGARKEKTKKKWFDSSRKLGEVFVLATKLPRTHEKEKEIQGKERMQRAERRITNGIKNDKQDCVGDGKAEDTARREARGKARADKETMGQKERREEYWANNEQRKEETNASRREAMQKPELNRARLYSDPEHEQNESWVEVGHSWVRQVRNSELRTEAEWKTRETAKEEQGGKAGNKAMRSKGRSKLKEEHSGSEGSNKGQNKRKWGQNRREAGGIFSCDRSVHIWMRSLSD